MDPNIVKEIEKLNEVVHSIKPVVKPLPGYDGEHVSSYKLCVSMDECFPGLYVGDAGAAKNIEYLKRNSITHVLNTAQGNRFATVNTSENYYGDSGIKYLGLNLLDIPTANIAQYFQAGTDFIHEALSGGGRVLVHCFMGISRSATISAAYLMMKHNMTAIEALTTLRKNRAIYPNNGFMRQLCELDKTLKE